MLKYEHGGDIYKNEGVKLDYSVNLNPLGMPEAVKQALAQNVDVFSKYPDGDCHALREKISRKEGVPAENILCGNGASDLIYRMCFALKPRTALVTAPAFSDYERAVRLSGGKVKYHKLFESEGFLLTKRILEDISGGTDIVFVCSPNNPTGRLVSFKALEAIAEKCEERGAYFVVDECFIDFTTADTAKYFMDKFKNIIILKAFTKSYAMAGLRLGYMMTRNTEVLEGVREYAQPWSVSAPAQAAGIAALDAGVDFSEVRRMIAQERVFLEREIYALGIYTYYSDVNFLLIKSAKPIYDCLLHRGILIRKCSNFEGLDEKYSRISIRTRAENEQFIAALREVLHG